MFNREFQKTLTGNHPRARPLTIEQVEAFDAEKALAFYRERFEDAGDFMFFFVGNIDLDVMKPLVEKWLGSLPSIGRTETKNIIRMPFPEGRARVDVSKGKEPKSRVRIAFGGDAVWSRDNSTDAHLLSEVLNIRLREILREDMGGVYGVSIWGWITREEPQTFNYEVQFGCAPEQVEPLTEAVFEVIREVRQNGIGDEYLEKVRENWKRTREEQEKQNGFWLGVISGAYRWNEDPIENLDLQRSLDRITSESVRETANKYLDPDHYLLGVLRPEEVDAGSSEQ